MIENTICNKLPITSIHSKGDINKIKLPQATLNKFVTIVYKITSVD
jgi:hypothetical protein